MHISSYAKMASFLRAYADKFPQSTGPVRILEVGSKSFEGQAKYRDLIDDDQFAFTGLDLQDGDNVDLVAKNGFVWPEIADGSFDVCISGQTFEHNPFFWVTMAEISRVLVPGGYACIIAPGSQAVHRYPLDCWRFYPDSWAALSALVGLEPVEIYFETDEMALSVVDGHVRDSMLIARKPERAVAGIDERLKQLTAPFRGENINVEPVAPLEGPCVADYRKTAPRASKWRARMANKIYSAGPVRVFSGND